MHMLSGNAGSSPRAGHCCNDVAARLSNPRVHPRRQRETLKEIGSQAEAPPEHMRDFVAHVTNHGSVRFLKSLTAGYVEERPPPATLIVTTPFT